MKRSLLAKTIGVSENKLDEVIRSTKVKRVIESDDVEKGDCAVIWLMIIYGWTYKYAKKYRENVLRRSHDSDGHTEHKGKVGESEDYPGERRAEMGARP